MRLNWLSNDANAARNTVTSHVPENYTESDFKINVIKVMIAAIGIAGATTICRNCLNFK